MPEANVALIGYAFMGRAHSNAWRQVSRFANGALASIEGTRFAPRRKNHLRFEVNGSRGTIVFNFERMNELEYCSLDDEAKVQGFRQILATDLSHTYFDR